MPAPTSAAEALATSLFIPAPVINPWRLNLYCQVRQPGCFQGERRAGPVLAACLASPANGRDGTDDAVVKGLTDQPALKVNQITDFTPFYPVGKRTEAEVKRGNAVLSVEASRIPRSAISDHEIKDKQQLAHRRD